MMPQLGVALVRIDAETAIRCGAYLTAAEHRACAAQRVASRRMQSACARVAAKWLRLELAEGRSAPLVALDAASLTSHARGQYLDVALSGPGGTAPRFADQRVAVSLSHAGEVAAAAVSPAGAVGVDVERVEPRSAAFADEHFTPQERDAFTFRSPRRADRAALETLLWSVKEALYKSGALTLPPRFSFRDIELSTSLAGSPFALPSVRTFALMACGVRFFCRSVLTRTFALAAVVEAPPDPVLARSIQP
ncbi:4'-phosphopantetheinyl transferase family protein [Chondromyces crocatus]|uniref:4'-phosphopantetheinyl transferase n=1 Tax=Chondromyces crocatus TaxID=52 RepID=A0A0K1EBJ1_CHOCO|nr:4'-phosphopantetheinyl transferase superfamily protein [Chondromyces crocatus]AKT38230.1 4'-phosphopantetheinyl transferase [Chondromyces crocatus]